MITDPQRTEPHPGGPMSVEDYLELDKNAIDAKYEYLDGVARLMSGGSGEHDQIARNTANAIEQHFLSGPCFVRGSDVQVLIGLKPNGKEQYVYPDVTVSCDVADRRRGNTLIRSPRLVVEVLSPSTEKSIEARSWKHTKNIPLCKRLSSSTSLCNRSRSIGEEKRKPPGVMRSMVLARQSN